jgi:hypothetical protein
MVLALFLLWSLLDSPGALLVTGGCVFFAGSLFIARNEARATPVLITPISWWFAWQAFSLGLCPIWLGLRIGGVTSINYVGQDVSINYVTLGFLYYSIGAFAMHFGLQRSRPRAGATVRSSATSVGSFALMVTLWSLGILLCLFNSRIAVIGTLAACLQMGALSATCSLAIAPPRFIPYRSPVYWGALAIATAGCAGGLAVLGLKFIFMLSALPVLWVFILGKQLRKALVLLVPALALTYLYVVEPVVDGLRGINRSADIKESLIADAQNGSLGEVAATEENTVTERLDGVAGREFSGEYLAYLIQDATAGGFRGGQTMEYLLYAFIPRVLWRDKPSVSRGQWYTAELGAASSEETATTSSALTAEGELYWNFGIAGMIAGMVALGWLIGKLLWRIAGEDPRTNPIRMLALLSTMLLVSGELEAGTMLVSLVTTAAVLWLLLRASDLFRALT